MSAAIAAGVLIPTLTLVSAATPLEALDSVFVVTTPAGSQGAAFAVDSRTLVTAAHVVEGVDRVRLRGTQDPPLTLEARVSYRDLATDVALLTVKPGDAVAPLTLASISPQPGDEVFAAGSPIDGVVLSRGVVDRIDPTDGIVSTTPVDPGNSGGPLLDDSGAVVGMVYAQGGFRGEAYSVPVETLTAIVITADQVPIYDSLPAAPEGPPSATPLVWVAVLAALAALAMSIVALIMSLGAHRRASRRPPPITITLDEE